MIVLAWIDSPAKLVGMLIGAFLIVVIIHYCMAKSSTENFWSAFLKDFLRDSLLGFTLVFSIFSLARSYAAEQPRFEVYRDAQWNIYARQVAGTPANAPTDFQIQSWFQIAPGIREREGAWYVPESSAQFYVGKGADYYIRVDNARDRICDHLGKTASECARLWFVRLEFSVEGRSYSYLIQQQR